MADQEEKVEQQEETAEEAPATEEATEEAAPTAEAAEEATEEPASEEPAEAAAEEPAEEPAAEEEPAEAAAEEAAEAPAEEESKPEADAPAEEYSWEVLHKKTVSELRDIAQGIEHDALQGYSTMHKEQLVPAVCEALGIEAHAHHEVVGINKGQVKDKIKALKVERQAALEAGDHAQLKLLRRRIKSLKRKIRRATV